MGIAEELNGLDLPPESYIVVGSAILEVLGIRPAADIDLIVTPAALRALADSGWTNDPHPTKTVLRRGRFEATTTWTTPEGEASLPDLTPHSVTVDGRLFLGLPYLLHWKKAMARPKDLADVTLIEQYTAAPGDARGGQER